MSKSKPQAQHPIATREVQTVTPDEVGNAGTLVPTTPPPLSMVPAAPEAARAFMEEAKGKDTNVTRLPLVTIDHQKGCFKMPDGQLASAVSGYPLYLFQTRRFYKAMYRPGQQGMPPDCWSADMLVPHPSSLEQQNPTCQGCPMNEYGSARDGKGKACGTYTWTFLLNPEFGTPPLVVMVAPPSSIKPLLGGRFEAGYFGQAKARHGAFQIVWSTFGLKKPVPESVHHVVEPRMGLPCDIDTAKHLASLRNKFLEQMEDMRMSTPTIEDPQGEQSEQGETA